MKLLLFYKTIIFAIVAGLKSVIRFFTEMNVLCVELYCVRVSSTFGIEYSFLL
jgi:hypothetical protein